MFLLLRLLLIDLVKNRALSNIDVVAPEGIYDIPDFSGGDRSALQVLRIRIIAVKIVKRTLAGKGFGTSLIKKRDRVLRSSHFEADYRRKAFPEAAQAGGMKK